MKNRSNEIRSNEIRIRRELPVICYFMVKMQYLSWVLHHKISISVDWEHFPISLKTKLYCINQLSRVHYLQPCQIINVWNPPIINNRESILIGYDCTWDHVIIHDIRNIHSSIRVSSVIEPWGQGSTGSRSSESFCFFFYI